MRLLSDEEMKQAAMEYVENFDYKKDSFILRERRAIAKAQRKTDAEWMLNQLANEMLQEDGIPNMFNELKKIVEE